MSLRYATITGGTFDQVAAYLPRNYTVVGQVVGTDGVPGPVLIAGQDHAGWTLDDYVIPRLASGLMFATELSPVT